MSSEESLENIRLFLHNAQAQIEPVLYESFKKAIKVLTIDVSKQKMKEPLKKNKTE